MPAGGLDKIQFFFNDRQSSYKRGRSKWVLDMWQWHNESCQSLLRANVRTFHIPCQNGDHSWAVAQISDASKNTNQGWSSLTLGTLPIPVRPLYIFHLTGMFIHFTATILRTPLISREWNNFKRSERKKSRCPDQPCVTAIQYGIYKYMVAGHTRLKWCLKLDQEIKSTHSSVLRNCFRHGMIIWSFLNSFCFLFDNSWSCMDVFRGIFFHFVLQARKNYGKALLLCCLRTVNTKHISSFVSFAHLEDNSICANKHHLLKLFQEGVHTPLKSTPWLCQNQM